jgi:lipid-A-disaccharide synthase
MKIGIVAGEASGDLLAAGLIRAIKAEHPHARFEGIAGPAMIAAGCKALYPSDKLAVMGLMEVLSHFRELKEIQNNLIEHFFSDPPDVFIGVDAPDFNLTVERKLKENGIKTVHYVSPSVWAWRQYRVRKIGRSVNLMLTLFPFEADFYRKHGVAVEFVGHPLADMIPLEVDSQRARSEMGLPLEKKLVALLPGSRMSEARMLTRVMLDAAALVKQRQAEVEFVMPLATAAIRQYVESLYQGMDDPPVIHLIDGRSREVMAAADVILLASGTAALEAMLCKRPMVVTYKLAPLTYAIYKRLIKSPYVSLPNILAGEEVARELLQEQATAPNLADEVLKLLHDGRLAETISTRFRDIHLQLKQDASRKAAAAVFQLIQAKH